MNDSKLDDVYGVSDWVSDTKLLAADSRAVGLQTSTINSYYVMGVDVSGFVEVSAFCRDVLQGCYKDYVFYRLSGNNSASYALLIGDSVDVDNDHWYVTASADDPIIMYGFTVDYQIVNRNLSRGSGTYRLPDFIDGNSLPTNQPYIFYYNRYHEDVSVSISYVKNEIGTFADLGDMPGTTSVLYSSLDGYPRLIEGVQNYAVAAFVLAFAVLAFKLVDRIFRRVY